MKHLILTIVFVSMLSSCINTSIKPTYFTDLPTNYFVKQSDNQKFVYRTKEIYKQFEAQGITLNSSHYCLDKVALQLELNYMRKVEIYNEHTKYEQNKKTIYKIDLNGKILYHILKGDLIPKNWLYTFIINEFETYKGFQYLCNNQ